MPFQVVPPSLVLRIVPEKPTVYPVFESVKTVDVSVLYCPPNGFILA